MGGQSCNYTYDSDTGLITVPDVTGDLVVTATVQEKTFCLAEGTKILLANGRYKNIEDVKYTDLLKVYNHVTGEFTDVYPIWIEKEGVSRAYRKISFSDGSYLKIVSNHSIFDVDRKKYINVSDDNECKIGNRIYKVNNNKLEIVEITNIEDIEEEVKYYSVVSTMFYNVIANNILTTDTTSSISNIYGFEDNAIYGENYYNILNGEKLEYKDIRIIPYYLYKGLNLQNAKCLINNGLDIDFLKSFISRNTSNFIIKDGKRYFIVTTDMDVFRFINPDRYLYEEGSLYKLPNANVKCFVNTATGETYKPGETVNVQYNMHFNVKN